MKHSQLHSLALLHLVHETCCAPIVLLHHQGFSTALYKNNKFDYSPDCLSLSQLLRHQINHHRHLFTGSTSHQALLRQHQVITFPPTNQSQLHPLPLLLQNVFLSTLLQPVNRQHVVKQLLEHDLRLQCTGKLVPKRVHIERETSPQTDRRAP